MHSRSSGPPATRPVAPGRATGLLSSRRSRTDSARILRAMIRPDIETNPRSPCGGRGIRSPATGSTSSMPAGGTTGERPGSSRRSETTSRGRSKKRSALHPPRWRPSSPTCTRRCRTTCGTRGTRSSRLEGGKRTSKKGPAAPASVPSSSTGLQRAHELFKQGRGKEALALLRPLLQRKGEVDGDACALAAACLGAEGDYAEAARVDRLLCDADPDNPQGWNSLGYDLFHAGDLDGALEAFEHAVGLEPTRASTYFNLARIAARMGDKSKVIEHFARAVELQPDLRPFKDDPDMLARLPGGTPTGDPYAEYYATRP